jgi:hypothetical protein
MSTSVAVEAPRNFKKHVVNFSVDEKHRKGVERWVADVQEFFSQAEAEASASRQAHASKTHGGARRSKNSPQIASRHTTALPHSSTGLSGGTREPLSAFSSNSTDLGAHRATGSDSYLQQALEALCINTCVKLAPNVGHAYDSIRMSSAELFMKLATVFNAGECVSMYVWLLLWCPIMRVCAYVHTPFLNAGLSLTGREILADLSTKVHTHTFADSVFSAVGSHLSPLSLEMVSGLEGQYLHPDGTYACVSIHQ